MELIFQDLMQGLACVFYNISDIVKDSSGPNPAL